MYGETEKCGLLYLCQSYAHIPKYLIRDNVNLLVLFRKDNINLKHVYTEHVNTDMPYTQFRDLCSSCWNNDKYSLLSIKRGHPIVVDIERRTSDSMAHLKEEENVLNEIVKSREAIRRKYK